MSTSCFWKQFKSHLTTCRHIAFVTVLALSHKMQTALETLSETFYAVSPSFRNPSGLMPFSSILTFPQIGGREPSRISEPQAASLSSVLLFISIYTFLLWIFKLAQDLFTSSIPTTLLVGHA